MSRKRSLAGSPECGEYQEGNMTQTETTAPAITDQAPKLLGQIAGYAGHRTIGVGLRSGLIEALSGHPEGTSSDELANELGFDPFYVGVWCRSALAAGVCEREGEHYRLAPHMDTLLLDTTSPAYVGGTFQVFEQYELFDRFEEKLATGERLWWTECSPEWLAAVSGTGGPFYTRLVPNGLAQVPGLQGRLEAGCRIVDTACGAGVGVARLAEHYPNCQVVGIDGDARACELAREAAANSGLGDRVALQTSSLEEMHIDEPAALVTNNVSMHECRDIDRVTENVREMLEPGGWFVISDFPFPDTDEGLASVPGRIMSGIQFFEAQIDDQLLPRSAYDELLERHGFTDIGSVQLTPVHALTWGRRA
ncbi:MAG: class I SAM-dependent methyltransferase [Dehalococcoidia bacterium]|nr:class I SAM-dependent methyltransferase [Dehalococcoidia bacterium]